MNLTDNSEDGNPLDGESAEPRSNVSQASPAPACLYGLPFLGSLLEMNSLADPGDAAIRYARLGFKVVLNHGMRDNGTCSCSKRASCRSPGKHPVFQEWTNAATSDPALAHGQVLAQQGKDLNVGLLMGGSARIIAIDVDGAAGAETLAKKQIELGALPPTLQAATGGGGSHLLFVVARHHDLKRLKSQANAMGAGSKVDLRADGSQIIVAPSKHRSGNVYAWVNQGPFATLPDAWYEALASPTSATSVLSQTQGSAPSSENLVAFARPDYTDERVRAALDFLATQAPAVSGEGGHATTFRVAIGLVRGCNLNQDEALALMLHEYNPSCRPSWTSAELAHKVRDADLKGFAPRGYLLRKSMSTAASPWTDMLKRNRSGEIANTLANVVTILNHDPAWHGVIGFDERAGRIALCTPPPWHADLVDGPMRDFAFKNEDATRMAVWLQRTHGVSIGTDAIVEAVLCVASKHGFDPVATYLDALRWDGVGRVDRWLVEFLGADDSPYVRSVGAAFLISAVARAYVPGAKVDHVLVLEGPQGLGKSTVLRELAGAEYFQDSLADIKGKDGQIGLQGAWIVELAELDAYSRSEMSAVKAFLTRCTDHYRPPYGRIAVDFPRRAVFAATTNEGSYLRDPTGNRRMWPVACRHADADSLRVTRDLLWAEATWRFKKGEPWWLVTDMAIEAAGAEQAARFAPDVWEDRIATIVSLPQHQVCGITTGDILERIGVEPALQDRSKQMRVAASLQRLGWVRKQKTVGGKQTWRYFPASPAGGGQSGTPTATRQADTNHQPTNAGREDG